MILALGHRKQVGKDEFYKICKSLYPDLFINRIAFADPLKEEIFTMFLEPVGLPMSTLDDPNTKPIVRPIMQGWGTIRRELFDPGWWINRALEKVSKDKLVINIFTDERYLNENKAVREAGGKSILILRDSVFDPNETHPSEIELDPYHHLFDHVIENNGTLEEYKVKIKSLMDKLIEEEANQL